MNVPPHTGLPSLPPRGITWPMVAYALVKELPYTTATVGGTALALVLVYRVPEHALHAIGAAVLPVVISALGRSRPAESDVSRLLNGSSQ